MSGSRSNGRMSATALVAPRSVEVVTTRTVPLVRYRGGRVVSVDWASGTPNCEAREITEPPRPAALHPLL